MMRFYAVGKEIKLSDKTLIIKRAGCGEYFRLLYLLLELDETNRLFKKAQDNLKGKELYLNLFKINLVSKILNKQFIKAIEPLIDFKWKRIKHEDREKVIEEILNVNSYKKSEKHSTDTMLKEDLEKEYEFIMFFLLERGYKLDEAAEVSYYEVCSMIDQWKLMRLQLAGDVRIAMNADKEGWESFEYAMKGIKVINSIEDLRKLADG